MLRSVIYVISFKWYPLVVEESACRLLVAWRLFGDIMMARFRGDPVEWKYTVGEFWHGLLPELVQYAKKDVLC